MEFLHTIVSYGYSRDVVPRKQALVYFYLIRDKPAMILKVYMYAFVNFSVCRWMDLTVRGVFYSIQRGHRGLHHTVASFIRLIFTNYSRS